jgi:hypothetical protein
MSVLVSNRALLRGMLAAAVVLTGTACSRPDRSDRSQSGSDTSAAMLPDSSSNTAQPSSGGAATGSVSDTATTSAQSDSLAQPSTSAQSNTPRAETTAPSDKDAAGYRPMERDTTNIPDQQSDSVRVTADTTETSSGPADTSSIEMAGAAAGNSEMARDTSTVAEQADTAAAPSGDVVLQTPVDTSSQAEAEVSPEAGVAIADSTEILGANEAADETADEQVVRPEDRETVAASEAPADEVGAAAIGGNVTGAEAVALMDRAGVRCAVVDPEANEAVRWDMSSTPVMLNPCGMGSMVPSRMWTRVE